MKKIIGVLFVTTLFSCTDNQMAKNYGGTQIITLDKNVRLVNITWKQDNIWLLTKIDTTKPTTYSFKEKANYNILSGEIIIKEN